MTLYMSKYQGLEMRMHLNPFHANLFHANLFHAIQRGGSSRCHTGVAVHGAGGGRMNDFCK